MRASAEAPLRVLVAHNRYQHRGGEDTVVEAEIDLLRTRGHEVLEYSRDNHDIDAMPRSAAALQTLWSRRTSDEVAALIHSFRPQVLHVHNTFPLISPSIYWAAARQRLPVVQTLHNFRLVCPQGLMLRDGQPCEACVGHPPWRAVRYRCYRGSAAQSAVLAAMIATHRLAGTWQHRISRYIALNTFCRDRFIAGGLPARKIRVKPNFVDLPPGSDGPRSGFLFVGRLSMEKGVSVLAEAARSAALGETLFVAGSGPEASLLAGIPNVQALGALPSEEIYALMRRVRALVLPSIWYENFPRTLVEAYACGLPVIASRLGAMASLVHEGRTGLLFEAGNAAALAATLAWAQAHPDELAAMGHAARSHYEAELTADANYRQLIEIYADAIMSVEEPA